jgi:4-hydroxy-2-oxoheptanedioate aldolase
MAMIETAEALRNVEEICRTPGLDAVYVGPADLSHSMGLADRANYKNPALLAAVDAILAAAKAAGIVAGAHTASVEDGQLVRSKGFQFATVSSDARLLALGANAIVKAMKGGAGAR